MDWPVGMNVGPPFLPQASVLIAPCAPEPYDAIKAAANPEAMTAREKVIN